MELKQLKEFGKEVGLKLAQMNKMSDDDLVLEIIRNVEPKVQYSKELVVWYDELDDSLFDQAEAEAGAAKKEKTTTTSDDSGISTEDVIEVIEGYSKKAELTEILEDGDVAPLFEGFDASAYKLPTQLKKAMIEFLKAPPADDTPFEPETGNEQLTEIKELINECENEDQLVEVYSEYQDVFGDMEVPDDVDEEALQSMMLNHVKLKEPQPETKKPMTLKERIAAKQAEEKKETKITESKPTNEELFDWWNPSDEGFDPDNAFAKVEELKMTTLRQFAKHIGLTIKVGKKKDEILDLVANKIAETIEGVSESTDTDNITITKELINDAAKGKDKDSLIEMCDMLEIKLNALQKKSVPGMQKKLIAAIKTETATEETTTTTIKDRSKPSAKSNAAQSVYAIMEEMVLAGKSEDAITKKVMPIYKDRGKSIIFIKKRVHTMIGVIKVDHGMEK